MDDAALPGFLFCAGLLEVRVFEQDLIFYATVVITALSISSIVWEKLAELVARIWHDIKRSVKALHRFWREFT